MWYGIKFAWLLRWALACLLACGVNFAMAENYPAKPLRLVIAFAPGSATDSVGRILGDELSRTLGQPVIVENRAGAYGQIAASFVAKSAPDGYTLLMTTNSTHSANPHLYRTLPYDPIKDFEPVARVGLLPFMLVVNPELPVKNTAELIAYAKANPDKLSYATASSSSLIAAETINALAHISMVGVPYKASQQALLDVVAGRLQVMVADFATAIPQVRAGKLRVLAVATAKRSVLLPDSPPIADTLKGFDLNSWNGLFVPAGTPKDIVAKLARATLGVLTKPEVKARLAGIGFEVDPLGSQAFEKFVREQIVYWGKLVRNANIQPE